MFRRNTAIAMLLVAALATFALAQQPAERQDPQREERQQAMPKPNPNSGYLGVKVAPVDDDAAERLKLESQDGLLVAEILPGSPAERDGLKKDDVIVKVNDAAVATAQDFVKIVWNSKPDDKVKFNVMREGKAQDITVTLGKRPAQMPGEDRKSEDHKDQDKEPATKPG
jgi:serine protease Do